MPPLFNKTLGLPQKGSPIFRGGGYEVLPDFQSTNFLIKYKIPIVPIKKKISPGKIKSLKKKSYR